MILPEKKSLNKAFVNFQLEFQQTFPAEFLKMKQARKFLGCYV